LVHASGNKEEAEKEIKHWFKKEELFDYDPLHGIYTR
jgi:nucleoside-diphosphate kinase